MSNDPAVLKRFSTIAAIIYPVMVMIFGFEAEASRYLQKREYAWAWKEIIKSRAGITKIEILK